MLTRWQSMGDMRTEMSRLHDEMNRLVDRWAGMVRWCGPWTRDLRCIRL